MALPGLSLPGLSLSQTPLATTSSGPGPLHSVRRQDLTPRSEWRFEVSFSQRYTIRVESGTAELFGVELAPKQTYSFSGCKGAVFTWSGCQLEISGDAESEYAGHETEYAIEWLSAYGTLETLRAQEPHDGPKVLVVGPDFVGKTSLVRSLAAWSVRKGRSPAVVNLDPREGLLAPPSSLTAVVVDSQMDVENGYGIGPMSGPTISPLRMPLIYHCPYSSPADQPDVYKSLITRMALSIMNKVEEDAHVKQSGIIVDSPGALNDPKTNYDLISHIVSELSINVIISMGSERLFSDLNRKFGSSRPPEEFVTLLRVSKPGGAVERDNTFMKQMRTQQIRQYFFGSSKEPLNPHSHVVSFAELTVFRPKFASSSTDSFGPGMDEDDYDVPYAAAKSSNFALYDPVAPTTAMMGSLMAIKFCSSTSDEQTIRDSAVMGFLYVADVDETRKKVRFLAPHPQRWGDRALVWGNGWPEPVADLVA